MKKEIFTKLRMLIIQALMMFPKMTEIRRADYSNKMVTNNQQQY